VGFNRHYRVPGSYAWMLRGQVLFGVFVLALGLATNEGGAFGIVVCGLGLMYLAGTWSRSERSWPRTGLYETPEGLRVVRLSALGGVRDRLFRWTTIACFEPGTYGFSRRAVMAVGTNGSRENVVGGEHRAPERARAGAHRDAEAGDQSRGPVARLARARSRPGYRRSSDPQRNWRWSLS
jgi:hypothetical protein